jgi:hypothetical protein
MPRKKASAGGCRLLKIGISGNGINAISLECRIKIYRPCKPANPAFTMSMIRRTRDRVMTREHVLKLIVSVECLSRCRSTKPLYHFASEAWWSQTGSNRRPHACKARALPTELWPRDQMVGPGRVERPTSRLSGVRSNHLSYEPGSLTRRRTGIGPARDRRKEEEKRRGRLSSHCLLIAAKRT